MMEGNSRQQPGRRGGRKLWLLPCLVLAVASAIEIFIYFHQNKKEACFLPELVEAAYLDVNPYSRCGETLPEVKAIVIHYVGNPGTSAQNNRNYFNNLQYAASNPSGTSASSHFIVGLEGEVLQCIPLDEVAYANYPRNYETVSIEVCHPDETGEFNELSRASLVKLAAALLVEYDLQGEEAVIRHHDVSGKNCPKYYVEHEEAWEALRADILAAAEALRKGETE